MSVNPTKIVLEALTETNAKSGDPRLTFVNLLTAAVIAGKIIGLKPHEIRRKLKEVEVPANKIATQVMGNMQ